MLVEQVDVVARGEVRVGVQADARHAETTRWNQHSNRESERERKENESGRAPRRGEGAHAEDGLVLEGEELADGRE